MRFSLEVVVKVNATGRWVAYLATASRLIDSATFGTEEEAVAWLKAKYPEVYTWIFEEDS